MMDRKKIIEMMLTVLVRFGSKGLNFAVFLLVARSLTISEMGVYGLVFSTAFILSVLFDFGLRNSSAIYVAGTLEKAKEASFLLHLSWLLFSSLGVLFLISLPYFLQSMESTSDYALPFAILFSGMLYIRIMQGALLGVGYINDFNRSELSSRLVLIILTLYCFLYEGLTITNALWSLALSQIVASLYLFLILLKRGFLVFKLDVNALKEMLKRGVLFMIAVVIMSLSKRLTFFALGEYSTLDTSGAFFVLLRISEIVTEIALAIAVVLFSHSLKAETKVAAIQGVAITTRHMTGILLVMTIAIFCASSIILRLLFPLISGEVASFDVILWGTFIGSIWVMIFPSLASFVNPLVVALLFIPSVVFLISAFYFYIEMSLGIDLELASQLYLISNIITLAMFLGFIWKQFQVPPISFLIVKQSELNTICGMFLGKIRGMIK